MWGALSSPPGFVPVTGMGQATKTRFEMPTVVSLSRSDRASWHDRASALYEELRSPATALVRRAYGTTFAADEIEDFYSNAWLGTLRSLERRHAELSDEEIKSYLLTAVANHAGKEVRRRKRKPVSPIEAATAVAEVGVSPEEAASTNEAGEVTKDLLSSLPPRRRAVMLLRYGWGLEPDEVCGMIDGLSARAYRKEVTRGINELTQRIKLVEDGSWCGEREDLLKTFAAGLATEDQALQAQHHLSHCRSCSEFVARLNGHLHDLGSSIMVPGALEAVDGHSSFLERARDIADNARESVAGVFGRTDPSEGVAVATGARGAGAAGAGALAKLSGAGGGVKAALACLGGGLAATACVATGVVPVSLDDIRTGPPDRQVQASEPIETPDPEVIDVPTPPAPVEPDTPQAPVDGGGGSEGGGGEDDEPAAEEPAEEQAPARVVEPSTPPVQQEFGAESVAAPSSPAPSSGGGGGGSSVNQEFGP